MKPRSLLSSTMSLRLANALEAAAADDDAAVGVNVQREGEPVHVHPVRIVQYSLHASLLRTSPVSHCSPGSTLPSPQ